MMSAADRLVLGALAAAVGGAFGPHAVDEASEMLRDATRRSARRRLEAVRSGQFELPLEEPSWPAIPILRKRAAGDASGIVVTERARPTRRRPPGSGRAPRARHTSPCEASKGRLTGLTQHVDRPGKP